MTKNDFKIIKLISDILVIGGGMAGFYSAIRSREKGKNVILVDKSTTGRSGFTPWANTFSVFNRSLGDDENAWIKGAQNIGEYLVNLDYFNMQIEDSLNRYNELLSWGIVDTRKEEWDRNGAISARSYLMGHDRRILMPKILKDKGVTLIQRVMITDLIKKDKRIIGAIGFHVENKEIYIFNSKAVILCTGAGGYKAPGYPIHSSTFDGDAMAYNAGASISGKDFMDFHFTGDKTPWDVFAMESEVFVNRIYPTKGPAIGGRGAWIDPIFKVEKYGPPIKRFFEEEEISIDIQDPRNKGKSVIPIMPDGNIVMGSATGLGVHKSEGIWPVDEKCFSGIEGLYSAGDALASYISGTCYPSTGLALSGSAVQGYRAGEYASEYTNNIDYGTISENVIKRFTAKILNPLFIDKGFNPRWVNNVLLNTMSPFYILLIMNEERLKSALKQIEYLKNSTENRMRAGNLHELRLVFETKNILLNAEMKLRANIFRTESRGNHFREDFPYRNDKEWLAWVLIGKDENGIMKLRKEPVPEKWKTDIDEPYDKRYPNRFPGEAVNSVQ